MSSSAIAIEAASVEATPARKAPVVIREPQWVKWLLITLGLGWFAALLLLGVGIWYWRHKKQARASK